MGALRLIDGAFGVENCVDPHDIHACPKKFDAHHTSHLLALHPDSHQALSVPF